MNVSEIKTGRCSESSVPHKNGCLISFTIIHLEEKEMGGEWVYAAHKNLNSSWFVLAKTVHHVHLLLQSGSIISLLQFNAFSALPFILPQAARQNKPYTNSFK